MGRLSETPKKWKGDRHRRKGEPQVKETKFLKAKKR